MKVVGDNSSVAFYAPYNIGPQSNHYITNNNYIPDLDFGRERSRS